MNILPDYVTETTAEYGEIIAEQVRYNGARRIRKRVMATVALINLGRASNQVISSKLSK